MAISIPERNEGISYARRAYFIERSDKLPLPKQRYYRRCEAYPICPHWETIGNIILAIKIAKSYYPNIMKQDKLADYSLQLARASMEYAQHLHGYGAKKDQFLRASSAIGANIAEAKYGNGPADFVNKLHTALKECNETKFWLELFTPETEEQAAELKKMKRLNGNIMRMLIQSINTVKARPDWKR